MIAVVNYGLGNIQAFLNIYRRLEIEARATATADDLLTADKIVLPGVGAFDWAMVRLEKSGMRGALEYLVLGKHIPVLGVCVGMQVMADRSEEGQLEGLGWIPGKVKRFNTTRFSQKTQLPHMGWNDVVPRSRNLIFRDMSEEIRAYFLHSYYFVPETEDHVLATTDYGGPFVSSIRSENIFGVQFHPEKSHYWGIQLLKNFGEM